VSFVDVQGFAVIAEKTSRCTYQPALSCQEAKQRGPFAWQRRAQSSADWWVAVLTPH